MQYRKKPVVIEAFRWTGSVDQTEDLQWIVDAVTKGEVYFKNQGTPKVKMLIKHSSGLIMVRPGEWVIQGVKGEIYNCTHEIFEATYEKV